MEEQGIILESASFKFSQDPNCVSPLDAYEFLTIEAESSLGIDRDEECFFVLKTEGWSVDGVEDLEKLFNVNVGIAVELNREIVEKNNYNKNLKIIHVSSVAGIESTASVGYSMVKAALITYSKTLSKRLIKKNIYVHCVLPGAFEYENNSFERLKLRNKKIYKKFIREKLPLQKIASAENFLGLFKFLISNEGNILSGSSVTADYSESNSFRI